MKRRGMKRIPFLDFVRVTACFLVMLVHASENYYPGPGSTDMAGPQAIIANNIDRLWVSVYDGFSRMSVPLFIIVSAFLLAPMKEVETSWTFYRRRFLRILPPTVVFMVIYSTLPMLWGQIDVETSLTDLSRIPLNFPSLAGHLWFMYPLISIYLFIPIISPWLRKATAKEERFFIALFLLASCLHYLNRFLGEVWGQCFWNEFHALWYFSGFLGYLVMAHYIHHHLKWSNAKRLWIGGSVLAVAAVWTILSFYIQATPGVIHATPDIELGWNMCTINVALCTFGAFVMFTCIKKENKLIVDISKMSFGMYLMHILWLGLWVSIFKPILPTVAAIPAIAVATFVSSYIATKILSYLPYSYWILGTDTKK